MTNTVAEVLTFDWKGASVPKRSLWLLDRLREMPGTIDTIADQRVLRLELATGLAALFQTLLPNLSEDQAHASTAWLKKNGYRDNKGKVHFIRLDEPQESVRGSAVGSAVSFG